MTAYYNEHDPNAAAWLRNSITAGLGLLAHQGRAADYASEFDDNVARSLEEDTIPLFNSNESEIKDWAAGNMNWSDVKDCAVKMADEDLTDFQEGWVNGEKELALLPSAIKP